MKSNRTVQIAEEIASLIGKGVLHPGERLVEVALSEKFQCSRALIRDALLMLERDGLVEKVPNAGAMVKNFTKEEIHELYDVIYRLEEMAIEKASSRATEQDFFTLLKILEEQSVAVNANDIHSYFELNEKYHLEIFNIAGNRTLVRIYKSLRMSVRPFRMLVMGQGSNLLSSYLEHKRQVEALRAHNIRDARYAIREQEIRSLKSLDVLFPE